MMKANMMRAPLIKSAAVLLVFVLLAYLTSASPEGSVLNSVGLIIIGAFRFVQWLIAMAIGLAVCIAFLIGVFLFAVSLVNKETAASMYGAVKSSVAALCQPVCSRFGAFQCKETQCAPPAQAAATEGQLKEDLHTLIAGEVKKVTDNQQALSAQFSALNSKIETLEEKSADFAVAGQLEVLAAEINASGKILGTVQENVASLESKINDTVQQLQTITPEKMLGEIPARLEKLEQGGDEKGFDPAPLTASIESLQKEMEELKKKNTSSGRAKKKT
jgi:prefoldin subunit 5